MRVYNPDNVLISVHIPKCGGTSFDSVLAHWFGKKFIRYYTDVGAQSALSLPKQGCLHGHFYHPDNCCSVGELFPANSQFISIVREPLNLAISSYYYNLACGVCAAESIEAHLEQVLSWGELPHFRNLPFDLNATLDDVLQQRFVWVSTLEDLHLNLAVLADRLHKPQNVHLPRLNTTLGARPKDVAQWDKKFRQVLQKEYALYESVQRLSIVSGEQI